MALKTREKVLLAAAVLIGVVMGFDQFVTLPKKKEVQALQKQVREMTEQMSSLSASLADLQPLRKRVEEKRKDKEVFSGRISDERQLDILLEQWGKESRMRKVEVIQLSVREEPAAEGRGRPESKSDFKKVALEVGLLADYGSIGPCLESILSLPLLLELEQVDISRKEESFPRLEVNLKTNLHMASPDRKGLPRKKDG